MNPNTQQLHEVGQSLWLDNISREILVDGTLARYISELSVTGLTSNPTIFEKAIGEGDVLRRRDRRPGAPGPVGRGSCSSRSRCRTCGRRPTCSGPCTTRPAASTAGSRSSCRRCWPTTRPAAIEAAARLHAAGDRPNLFIKIPGTPAGIPAIEESIFAGVPINVTLLFSREQYLAAAERLPARHRAPRRRRARSEGRIGGIAVRQPLGRGREGPGRAAVPQSPRHRDRQAHLQGVPGAAGLDALAGARARPAPTRSGCCGPAPAPRIRPRRTRSTSRPSPRPTRSTRSRRRRCRHSPTTARSARRCPSTAAMPRPCWRSSRAWASTTGRSRTAAARRRRGVREVLDGTAGPHRRETDQAGGGEPKMNQSTSGRDSARARPVTAGPAQPAWRALEHGLRPCIHFPCAARTPNSSARARFSTFSTVKPYSCSTTSAGAEAPKRSMPSTSPWLPT